tara:strand:- start:8961 stop:9191 length:231 start_codon:yes stop_codon:yes gene_type:complete
MSPLNEEITERFLEDLVSKAVDRLENALKQIDISMDYVAAALSGEEPLDMQIKQSIYGRLPPGSHSMKSHTKKEEN